jgi:hypothetical protein
MAQHAVHSDHSHTHGPDCGHQSIEHEGHRDYLHEGHLHSQHGDHVDEHVLAVGGQNRAECAPGHACGGHDSAHAHAAGCGHESVPHGDHVDYVVSGHLHSPHAGHCDDHGAVTLG